MVSAEPVDGEGVEAAEVVAAPVVCGLALVGGLVEVAVT